MQIDSQETNRNQAPLETKLLLVLVEWYKILALLCGIGALPLIASSKFLQEKQPWLHDQPHWLIIAAGILVLLAGLLHWLVQWQRVRALAQPVPVDEKRLPVQKATVRLYQHQFAYIYAPGWHRVNRPLEFYLPGQGRKATAHSSPQPDEAAWLAFSQPAITTTLGIAILATGLIAYLLHNPDIKNPLMAIWFFASPVFLIWVLTETYNIFLARSGTTQNLQQYLLIAKSGLQILSALVLWNYLGLSLGLSGLSWLFWTGAALTVLSALLYSVAAPGRPVEQKTPTPSAKSNAGKANSIETNATRKRFKSRFSGPNAAQIAYRSWLKSPRNSHTELNKGWLVWLKKERSE